MDDYEIDEIFASNPTGTTNAVIAEAAAVAAAEIAALQDSQRDADYQRVQSGQVESAVIAATAELKARYGEAEYNRVMPRLQERISRAPHLVPQEVWTSPTRLTESLDDVIRLARGDAAVEDQRDWWQKVKANGQSLHVGELPGTNGRP